MEAKSDLVFFTTAEAARRLRCSPRTLRSLIHGGRLRGTLLGRIWRVSDVALAEFEAHGGNPETVSDRVGTGAESERHDVYQ